jgi:hypothetical protein
VQRQKDDSSLVIVRCSGVESDTPEGSHLEIRRREELKFYRVTNNMAESVEAT